MRNYRIGDKFKLQVKDGVSEFRVFSKRFIEAKGPKLASDYEYYLEETVNKIGIKRRIRKFGSELENTVKV